MRPGNARRRAIDRIRLRFRGRTRVLLRLCIAGLLVPISCFAVFQWEGLKLLVVQPMPAFPNGAIELVRSAPAFNLVDSPDAVCERENADATLMCRDAVLAALGHIPIVLQLPYSEALYRLSGPPSDMP